jgi:sugar phosphate isomerase/epimerase
MNKVPTSRRGFLRSGTAAVGAAVAAQWLRFDASHVALAEGHGKKTRPIRLGGPVFNMPQDPEEMALAHRKLGYRAAYCPGVGLNDKERIRDISAAFAKHDVVIAEVGRWVNLLDADPAKRAANLKLVTEGLALAEAIGARCCVDIAGSYNPKVWYGPDPGNYSQKFFDEVVENARKIIDAVKPTRAKFTYEAMGWAIPDNPDSYLKLIKAVDRPAFGVHLDPCNMINCPQRFYNTTALLDECFDKLGPWIVSCHAKDLTWDVEMNIHFREVTVGAGTIDFTTYLKRLTALPGDATLMIEHMANAEEYDKARKCLLDLGQKNGIAFERP